MKVTFVTPGAPAPTTPRLVVRVVEQDKLPSGLDASVADAARASRFAGKLGQLFESFSGGGSDLRRNVMVGVGDPAADGRLAAFEQAGAAVTARYLTSGETGVAYDLGGSTLSADEVAALILGTVLRGWRYDVYRTRLAEER